MREFQDSYVVPETTQEQFSRARLKVASMALDAEDLRGMLGILGLLPEPVPEPEPEIETETKPIPKEEYLGRVAVKFCRNGHLRTEENTKISSRGVRTCRECRRESQRQFYSRTAKTCKNGHPWEEGVVDSRGSRQCLICRPRPA